MFFVVLEVQLGVRAARFEGRLMFRVPVVIRQEANLTQEPRVGDYVSLLCLVELSLQECQSKVKKLGMNVKGVHVIVRLLSCSIESSAPLQDINGKTSSPKATRAEQWRAAQVDQVSHHTKKRNTSK
jgi:hypothetical protein